ncbi:MAG: DNA-directed RNA polymerase subunit omega [Actinomycetota bacterium]|nr:DNA-directed RNA polymerase subunit omega [Actinomycetota bacterium]
MSEQRPTMMDPPIEQLLGRVEYSKFALVTLAGRRAREINSYFSQLGEGLGTIVPPQVHSLSHKPVTIALEEIQQSKIIGTNPPASEEAVSPPLAS